MRLLLFLCLIVFCFISSCKTKEDKKILPQEKMQSVIWKLIQADVYTTEFLSKDSGLNASTSNLQIQKGIFEKEKITKNQFQKSYDYYVAHPAMMRDILDTVLKRNSRDRRRLTDTLKIIQNE